MTKELGKFRQKNKNYTLQRLKGLARWMQKS